MDPAHDEPKISVNVHKPTTQLNLWMIVGIVVFFALALLYLIRVARHPPTTHNVSQLTSTHWVA